MTSLRSVGELVECTLFRAGDYQVSRLSDGEGATPLVRLSFDADDATAVRNMARVELATPADPRSRPQSRALAALGRAGLRLPGLGAQDVLALHRAARAEHHVELFADLCAISTGLLQALVRSLGRCLSRVVVSSSTIDVLHEYQGSVQRRSSDDFLRRNEMMRVLRVLEEIRRDVPVHVHQLAPGASRYFHRAKGGPTIDPDSDDDELTTTTYVSEDRQMIAAFWDYLATSNPRLPIRLVTSDHRLAHVCVAERVPYLFAPALAEVLRRDPMTPLEPLWFDPNALALRAVTAHEMLWELTFTFGRINIERGGAEDEGFSLRYDRDLHPPGAPEIVEKGPPIRPIAVRPGTGERAAPSRTAGGSSSKGHPGKHAGASADTANHDARAGAEVGDRSIKVPLTTMLDVLPTRPGQQIPVAKYRPRDADALRQLRHLGDVTRLFRVDEGQIVAGEALEELLAALRSRDYLAVNTVFRRYPRYDALLTMVAAGEAFPKRTEVTGWAVVLGAAYKSAEGVFFGLQSVNEADFEQAVERAHQELGKGGAAVPLALILDRVCREKRMSPIRFEAMLDLAIGKGVLQRYEAQRATHSESLSAHTVLVEPSTADPATYQRRMEPGKGVMIRGKLMGSLVRRDGGS